MSSQILSVSYDESLLKTRELLLKQHTKHGVTSALGFIEAVARCEQEKFNLLILGHSIPPDDKQELIKAFRKSSAGRILALHRLGETTQGADATVDPTDIDGLLETVGHLLHD